MRDKTTFLKISSLILGLVVFFFATVLKVESTPLVAFVSGSVLDEERVEDLDEICYVDPVGEDLGSMENVVFGDVQKPIINALFLVDFDDLEYTFTALSVSSKRAFFFQDVIETYSFVIYRKVKLFLFYSFIKIPTVFL